MTKHLARKQIHNEASRLTHQMVIDCAGQQPVSRVVSDHVSRNAGRREKTDRVCVVVLSGQDLAMEMNRMHVHLLVKYI